MNWLVISIALSILFTVLLNVAFRLFPEASQHLGPKLAEIGEKNPEDGIHAPWKAMIIISIMLTVALNLLVGTLR